jgi:hypothetical protein
MNQSDFNKALNDSLQSMTSDEVLEAKGVIEYNTSDIIKEFEDTLAYKQEQARIFKILDAADHSDIWKIYNRKIPNFMQTPTHNPITIIKEATKASVMPTEYSGEFKALSMDVKELADTANKYFQMKWEAANMNEVNNECADYAYLHGTSGILMGWNNNIVDSSDVTNYFNPAKHIQFQAKAYHPSNIFPDPGASTVEEMRYLFLVERKTKDFLRSIPRFQKSLYLIENSNDTMGNNNPNYILDKAKTASNDIVSFITCYKKVMRQKQDPISGLTTLSPSVDIIYLAGRNVLDVEKDIQPNCIPFIPLYDEKVPNNFWGISKCYKVLSLYLTLVQIDSIEATGYFKNQNPAEFINALAGLNVADYQNKRDNPDKAFTVNCDPKLVQAYAQRPDLPKTLDGFRAYLLDAIRQISGVDSAYLGQSYGSIQTTGGVQQAVDRATMRDANRIKSIDKFIRKELELMTQFFIVHGQQEKFYVPNPDKGSEQPGEELTFDPLDLIKHQSICIDVSNAAPRSNQSYEDAAMKLMELQMKYVPADHGYPDFITPEELIQWLNIPKPQQRLLIDRMKRQMQTMKLEEYTAVLTAIGTLTQGGMPVEQALMEVVKQMESALGQIPAANPNNVPSQQNT